MSILYTFVAIHYNIWQKNKLYGYNMLLITLFAVTLLLPAFLLDPGFFLGVFGKDSTLTGRTDVWDAVIELISQKPVSGWVYGPCGSRQFCNRVVDRRTGEWGAPSAHNAFLEITLELGLIGLASLILIVCQGLWRAIRCCALDLQPFGLFSLVFFVGAIMAARQSRHWGSIRKSIGWYSTYLAFSLEKG